MPPNINIVRVDYSNPQHCNDLCRLLLEYAEHETGVDGPVSPDMFDQLPRLLADFPTAFSLLARCDGRAVGLINGFFGLSTFTGRRLINVHDVVVTEHARGQGVAGRLLAEVEAIARESDCCRITLEVLQNNASAHRAYEKRGFTRTPYHPDVDTLFLQKSLDGQEIGRHPSGNANFTDL